MGFISNYVKPASVNSRNNSHLKGNKKCVAPGCNKNSQSGERYHGTCGRAACQGYVAGGW